MKKQNPIAEKLEANIRSRLSVTDWDCLKEYGADSIAVIWEENEDRRRVIVGDLLEYYSEAPCDPF